MAYTLSILLLLIITVIVLIAARRPVAIGYDINKFLDSYEKIDYDKDGKVKQDYLVWNISEYTIKVNYYVYYKWEKNPFNWKNEVSIKLDNIQLPDGFVISLKKDNNDFHEYHSDYEMLLTDSNDFFVKVNQIDNYIDLTQPQFVKFNVNVIVQGTNIRKTIPYEFLVGEDLGDSWVAFDPGTTATTIAFGNDNTNIIIAKNREGSTLTPSVLVFDKKDTSKSFFGDKAESRIKSTAQYIGFRSIKKLLGFKDTNKETGKNGKDLAAQLVSDIYNDIKEANSGIEKAKRAVVAIPNNYTAAKIKDMLFCIENLKQFKEIRPIYEAEAVVFYYLSNKSYLEDKFDCKNRQSNETILVFDMGGATINVTVAQISKQDNDTYEVNILSKIGYGIGGDSIDYCILRSIFDYTSEIPELQKINIFDKKIRENLSIEDYNRIKENLIGLSLRIKLQIAKNEHEVELISANDLQIYFDEEAGIKNIHIDVEKDFYRIFKPKSRFFILRNNYFWDLIYRNVNDATWETLKIAGNPKIDKVILSGRSTLFPFIESNISGSFPNIKVNISDEFSYFPDIINLNKAGVAKTAVAEGACWYGVNNNCIKLNNLKISANFGFVKTKSPDKRDISFVSLIGAGQNFIENGQGKIKSTQKTIDFKDRFIFDGSKVNFYQVMSNDCETVIAENQKHKYGKIETVKLNQESEKIGMRVNENDDVNCSVRLINGNTEKTKGVVADQEIADANEEHYTWIVNN
jgi:hypothetical protein